MRGSNTKKKGNTAELYVAADLADRGFRVFFPFGENCSYDIAVEKDGRFQRIQVKYSVSTEKCWEVKPRSGNERFSFKYTSEHVDYIAAYDARTKIIMYIPAEELGSGMAVMTFRFVPAANGQKKGIRFVDAYRSPPK